MIDWERNKRLLIEGSEHAIRAFLAQLPNGELAAIGYTFELWNESPQFNLCANARRYFQESMLGYRREWPETSEQQIRWSSGDFEFPAGLLKVRNELGTEWCAENVRLHKLSDADEMGRESAYSQEVYDGLVRISCEALAVLAKKNVFGDFSKIDFNVAEYGDKIDVIKERDRMIRALIQKMA